MRPSPMALRGRSLLRRAALDTRELAGAAEKRLRGNGRHGSSAPHRRPAEHRISPFIELFADLRPAARFVQIGGNPNRRQDPLREAFLAHSWTGVIVDPLPCVIAALQERYGERAGIELVQAAIGPADETQPFFYITPDDPGSDAENASWHESPKGSLEREVLYLAPNYRPDLDERIAEIPVRCLTFASLWRECGLDSLDVLAVATEGDEAAIIDQADIARLRPAVVTYDQYMLGAGVRQRSIDGLHDLGYEIFDADRDVWGFNPANVQPAEAEALAPVWERVRGRDPHQPLWITRAMRRAAQKALRRGGAGGEVAFPLTDHERHYLQSGYDDRTPLAPEAAAYLSEENPRLAALRQEYRQLDLGAGQHHYWSPETVTSGVDLRYFRGDNLYLWHYPEHPRAMALKLFAYLRYVEGRGGQALLRKLAEDGAFGCWTAEVHGYGKVSRDLLDSVNEILFLDRQLNLLTEPGVRVLDIGAGYGRLAHRMVEAAPGLTDYCCVDAIPESTFLSEFYLRYRGSSPPGRVITLGDVQALSPSSFDLAVNVHSFSECTIDAIQWWVTQLRRLQIPRLFVVPNEADGILSREPDGSRQSVLPVLAAAGYRPVAQERVIADRAVRDMIMIVDNFYLFELSAR